MILLAFVLIFVGFALLALAMDRHLKQLFPALRVKASAVLWRTLAVILLCASLLPAVLHYGLSIGITVWFGMATFAVALIGLLLSYQPRALRIFLVGIVRPE